MSPHAGTEPTRRAGVQPRPERRALGTSEAEARYVMDIYDGADWTEMDIEDLKASIEGGASIEDAAEFLCRSGTVDDVARKARELGLKPKPKS